MVVQADNAKQALDEDSTRGGQVQVRGVLSATTAGYSSFDSERAGLVPEEKRAATHVACTRHNRN